MIPLVSHGDSAQRDLPWGTIWSVVGPLVGVVIGALLTPFAAWHWQRKQLEAENKKDEYRSLLDVLGTCVQEIKSLKERTYIPRRAVSGVLGRQESSAEWAAQMADGMQQAAAERVSITRETLAALRSASKVLEDRLFIDEALRKHKIKEDWNQMQELAMLPGAFSPPANPEERRFDSIEFELRWQDLASKIRRIAREDID